MFKDVVNFVQEQFKTTEFIPLHEPRFLGNEKAYLIDTIDSTFVSSVGKYVDRFEEMIRDYTGAKYAVACVNGTAALHMSLILADVKRNDLVLTQALSFIATCNAISYIGAEPVFIDVNQETLGLCPDKLEAYLKENAIVKTDGCYHKTTQQKIAAVVPMHTFGFPVFIDKMVEVCNTWKIKLIEDAAESLGSTYQGKQTGTFGLLGTYSFNGNKTITCGGGGMIVTNNEEIGKMGKYLTTQAKQPHKWDFFHTHIGYNYRCPNLNAALACAQIEQLDGFLDNKRELAKLYSNFFNSKGIQFQDETKDAKANYWLNAIFLKDKEQRDEFLEFTNSNGVMTRPVWTLMNKLPMFQHCKDDGLENSQWIEDRLVNLPSSVRVK